MSSATTKRKTQKNLSSVKRLSQNTQEEYNKLFRRFIGNPNVRGKLIKENSDGYVVGPTLFHTDTKESMKLLKDTTRLSSEQPETQIFKDGFIELHFTPHYFKKKFDKFSTKWVKGTIVIREETLTENIPVHFCGYIYKNKILYIFDPSYSSFDNGTYFTDGFYNFLTEKKIKWEHVMKNRDHAWQDSNILLKEDYFCQTWSLKWLLNTTDIENQDFYLPKSPLETAQHVARYFHEILELIDQNGKRQEYIDLFPPKRWEGHDPNNVLNYIKDRVSSATILKIFHPKD